MKRPHPTTTHLVATGLLAGISALFLPFFADFLAKIAFFWLFSVNLITLAAMGKDKWSAKKNWRRTPEKTLATLAACGGWLGLVAGQKLFRHKTLKEPFRKRLLALFVFEVLAVAALLAWVYFFA